MIANSQAILLSAPGDLGVLIVVHRHGKVRREPGDVTDFLDGRE
ncbi:hypothetical protein ODJ79_03080 [Actinoplanes sp. KI2]|nr:hypothetical protein [Actinoplanes sp. KI2]MCU7722689.1 hypothetical protein [Actinoplanes sp. KI2]